MSLDFININNTLDAKNKPEDGSALKELKRYGLDKVESLSKQAGKIGGKIKGLFSGALSVFKKKTELIPGTVPELVDVDNRIEQEDDKVLVDDIVVCSEMDLYTKLDYLLYKLKKGDNLNGEDIREKITKLTRGTDFSSNELLDGQEVAREIKKKSVDLVEDGFKIRTENYLLDKFNGSKKEAKKFVEDRFKNTYEHNPPHFKLIEKKDEKGELSLELISDDFITGASTFSDLEEKKGVDMEIGDIDKDVIKEKQFLNAEKASESLAVDRGTLTEQLVSAMEVDSNGKVDQADWYEVGGMSANEALEMLRQVLNRRVERERFGKKTKKWIEDSINIFKPASDETFAEYIERRFMKGDRLPSIYNDVINVVKIFNKIQNRNNNNEKEIVDRQMIGEMPAEKVFDILSLNKKVAESSGIKFILLDCRRKINPIKGESLKKYFYRLTAYNRGCLRKDGTVDEEKLRNNSDFESTVQLLIDIIPPMNRRILFKDDVEHYNPHKTKSNGSKSSVHDLGLRNKGLIKKINKQYTRPS